MNYPPGVTGSEFAIAGPDYEEEHDEPCPNCEVVGQSMRAGYRRQHWAKCGACGHQWDIEESQIERSNS